MTGRIQKSHKGTVLVLSQKGLLRLRWRIEGSDKRPVLYLGLPDTRSNRKKAELLAKKIEIDLTDGSYDPTLEKYRVQIRPTNVNEQVRSQGESVVDFFDQFVEHKATEVDARTLEKYGALGTKLKQFFKISRWILSKSKRPRSLWSFSDSTRSLGRFAIAWRPCQNAESRDIRIKKL
jgi:Arm DNA-binding domain